MVRDKFQHNRGPVKDPAGCLSIAFVEAILAFAASFILSIYRDIYGKYMEHMICFRMMGPREQSSGRGLHPLSEALRDLGGLADKDEDVASSETGGIHHQNQGKPWGNGRFMGFYGV